MAFIGSTTLLVYKSTCEVIVSPQPNHYKLCNIALPMICLWIYLESATMVLTKFTTFWYHNFFCCKVFIAPQHYLKRLQLSLFHKFLKVVTNFVCQNHKNWRAKCLPHYNCSTSMIGFTISS